MLDKIKGISTQVASKASGAVEGIATTVKEGVDSLASTASNVTEALNEKAVRTSTAQVCRILEIAMEEMKGRPLAERPVTLTASVNLGIAALEMQVHLQAGEPIPGTPAEASQGSAENQAD